MSRRVQADAVVTLAYVLTDDQGNELEIRTPENPFVYIHGHGGLLESVEKRLEGQTPGFSASIRLEPREAYGVYRPELVAEMQRSQFPAGANLEVGLKFNTMGPDGQPLVVRVIELDEKMVTIDGNHPLAGIPLVFDVRVLGVRDATEAEIESGAAEPDAGNKPDLH